VPKGNVVADHIPPICFRDLRVVNELAHVDFQVVKDLVDVVHNLLPADLASFADFNGTCLLGSFFGLFVTANRDSVFLEDLVYLLEVPFTLESPEREQLDGPLAYSENGVEYFKNNLMPFFFFWEASKSKLFGEEGGK
jgi:hypothetical protein